MLEDLSFSYNEDLRYLDCSNNSLTDLDLNESTELSTFKCENNVRDVQNQIVFKNIMPDFEVAKASEIRGGQFKDGKIVFDAGSESITYTYDCGVGKTARFKLVLGRSKFSDVTGNDWF